MVIKSVIPYLLASLVSFSACAEKPSAADLPSVTVYKSPSCGCCVKWVEHMRKAGFEVTVNDVDNVHPVKMRVGVPRQKAPATRPKLRAISWRHSAGIGRKAAARGAAGPKGLAVPGMPMGSPGMEVPDGRTQAYDVELVAKDGTTSRFSRHGE